MVIATGLQAIKRGTKMNFMNLFIRNRSDWNYRNRNFFKLCFLDRRGLPAEWMLQSMAKAGATFMYEWHLRSDQW